LSAFLVAAVVVEGAPGVRRLERPVTPPDRSEERALGADAGNRAAADDVGWPLLRARAGAGAAPARIARERVERETAAVEENASVLRRVHRDARLRPGGCRSRSREHGGESDEDEEGAHGRTPFLLVVRLKMAFAAVTSGHASNVV